MAFFITMTIFRRSVQIPEHSASLSVAPVTSDWSQSHLAPVPSALFRAATKVTYKTFF